jgi:hypothetical protein
MRTLAGAVAITAASLISLAAADAGPVSGLADQQLKKLAVVRTLYVEDLVGEGSHTIRDLLITAVHKRGLFVIVEDVAIADAYIRGSAEDLIYTDYLRDRSGINVRGAASSSRRESGESDYGSASFGVSDNEETNRRDRKHEALAAVRVVLKNGEVVWAAAQESGGAKFRGAAADVAERVADDLQSALASARALLQKD